MYIVTGIVNLTLNIHTEIIFNTDTTDRE